MKKFLTALGLVTGFISCAEQPKIKIKSMDNNTTINTGGRTDTATFGTGCFWCTEAVFQQVEGVIKVTSGYAGGQKEKPNLQRSLHRHYGPCRVPEHCLRPSKGCIR